MRTLPRLLLVVLTTFMMLPAATIVLNVVGRAPSLFQRTANAAPLNQEQDPTWVGVIPGPDGCGPGYETVVIYSDDEDKDNKSSLAGWTGAIQQDSNTTWVFCRVDGGLFQGYESYQDHDHNYAVLRLDDSCPNGSLTFSRSFDSEDKNNKNRFLGPIFPHRMSPNVGLEFCVFFGVGTINEPPPSSYMSSFPPLPFEYGVFAEATFPAGMASGSVHTDDEDDDNKNGYGYDPGMSEDMRSLTHRIISGGDNTDVGIVKVYEPPARGNPDLCDPYTYCTASPRAIDLDITFDKVIPAGDQIAYTEAISHFADAIYEMTNGVHKVGTVYLYQNNANAAQVNVHWRTITGTASSHMNGYFSGGYVKMHDTLFSGARTLNVQQMGYTLAHEWGHYYYALPDEYRETRGTDKDDKPFQPHSDDIAAVPSVMNCQALARPGNTGCAGQGIVAGIENVAWLNFSSSGVLTKTEKTAQWRLYEAYGWDTLAREPSADPRDYKEDRGCNWYDFGQTCKKDKHGHTRQPRQDFSELSAEAPASGRLPRPDIVTQSAIAQARSELRVIWRAVVLPGREPLALTTSESNRTGATDTPFHVDAGLDSVDIIVHHMGPAGSQVDVKAIDPNGQLAGQKNCPSNGSKETTCILSVLQPAIGDWKAQVSPSDAALQYDIQVVAHQPTNSPTFNALVRATRGNPIQYPATALLVAQVTRGLPIARARLTGRAIGPDGKQIALTLRDDGLAPDRTADDGFYAGYLPYNQNGEYLIDVTFDNKAGNAVYSSIGMADGGETAPVGVNFQRSARTTVVISGYEADDHTNTSGGGSTVLTPDNVDIPGRIDFAADIDTFKVTAPGNSLLGIRIVGLGNSMDPEVRILGPDGTTVLKTLSYEPGSAVYPYAQFDATAGQVFFVEVRHQDPNVVGGTYWVSAGTPLGSGPEKPAGQAKPPTPPQLTVDSGNMSMELHWSVTNDPLVTQYRVLRSPTNGQNLQPIASSVVDTTYYDTDNNAANNLANGATYCYQVEALRADSAVSSRSNVACGVFGILDLWVPDAVGKPGDTVIVPINIRNADGLRIAASDIWLDFNPQVIASKAVSRTALTASYAWAHSVQAIDATTSRVRISYIHSDLNNLPPELQGDGSLFWLAFRVQGQPGSSTPLNIKDFITGVGGSSIQNEALADVELSLTDGLFTVQGAANANYILGDVDADTVVRARDAAIALRLANGERQPSKYELQAGDVNGNGGLDAPDSSMILHYAATNQWPAAPSIAEAVAAAAAPSAATTLRLDDAQGKPGETLQTSLRATAVQAMAGGSFVLVYDPAIVGEVVTVTRGSLAATVDQLEFRDDRNGILTISLADDAELNGDGELATIQIKLAPGAPVGVSPLRLADAKLNNLNGRDFVTGSVANTLTRSSGQLTVLAGDPVVDAFQMYLPLVSR